MNEDRWVHSVFGAIRSVVSITKTGGGNGLVWSEPPEIDCGQICEGEFPYGASIVLKAQSNENSIFIGWEGGECFGTGDCDLIVEEDLDISANFAPSCQLVGFLVRQSGTTLVSGFDSSFIRSQETLSMTSTMIGRFSTIEFKHRFDFDLEHGGRVLEYSTDSGRTWFDILAGNGEGLEADASRIMSGGYSGMLGENFPQPLAERWAWTGSSDWMRTVIDLSDFQDQNLTLRWRSVSDLPNGHIQCDLVSIELLRANGCPQDLVFSDGFETGDLTGWPTP